MSLSLSQRLQSLEDAYKETLNLIQELRKFSPTSYTAGDPEERRLELANEIHNDLKEQGDTLEILRQEFEDNFASVQRREPLSEREGERERNADLLTRLAEDLRSARATFRRAQLDAKRNADTARRKEREQLFAERKEHGQHRARPTHEKLTQDELAVRAADDVTVALRRVHNQLESELSRSQFAQQTLEESQQALESLTQSYAGTTDLLKASRGFVGQLVRSNKSDTWFLKSSFYLLAATICWLFYRRILYGPMIVLIWWPLRLMWWTTMTSLGAIGLGAPVDPTSSMPVPSLTVSMPGMNARGIPTHDPNFQYKSMDLPAKGGGWGGPHHPPQKEESLVEKIGKMAESTSVGDTSSDQQGSQTNSLKRMMEVNVEPSHKDEL